MSQALPREAFSESLHPYLPRFRRRSATAANSEQVHIILMSISIFQENRRTGGGAARRRQQPQVSRGLRGEGMDELSFFLPIYLHIETVSYYSDATLH